jgi:hypothetical protein
MPGRFMGFVVDEVSLGQVFSQYFGFPCQFSFYQIYHPELVQWASQLPTLEVHLLPPPPTKIKKKDRKKKTENTSQHCRPDLGNSVDKLRSY